MKTLCKVPPLLRSHGYSSPLPLCCLHEVSGYRSPSVKKVKHNVFGWVGSLPPLTDKEFNVYTWSTTIMNIAYLILLLVVSISMTAVIFSRLGIHRDRKWAAFYGIQTGERKGGTYTVFSLQRGKPMVILSDIFFGTQPSNRQHGCWRRHFQPWMAGEVPVTEVAITFGNRK